MDRLEQVLGSEYARVNTAAFLEPNEVKMPQPLQIVSNKKKRGRPHKSDHQTDGDLAVILQQESARYGHPAKGAYSLKDMCSGATNNNNGQPIVGLSVYDERNLRKKYGRRFKNIEKFVDYKL